MKQMVRQHNKNISTGEETYVFKFKDKSDQSAYRINIEGFNFRRIELIKVKKENNMIMVKLVE
jgi:hypothetical protein